MIDLAVETVDKYLDYYIETLRVADIANRYERVDAAKMIAEALGYRFNDIYWNDYYNLALDLIFICKKVPHRNHIKSR